ncbi:MAG: MBL fold metallo-hydrolase [Chloroflexia bacterium]|nr:MBL fold metallo-hydrolase [Chloroflexia bacterium]
MLVDAGFSASRLVQLLRERGVLPGDLDAILVSHEHSDHIRGVDVLARRFGTTVVANDATLRRVPSPGKRFSSMVLKTGNAMSIGPFEVASFPVSHDAAEPVGYLVSVGGARVAVATDLGFGTRQVLEAITLADLAVIEANHDVEHLIGGPYPWHLKRRILSESGHLSNRQSAEIIADALTARRQTYWLAHLSRTNNTKTLAEQGVREFLISQGLAADVAVLERDRPSLTWEPQTQTTG